ncbi:MAG: DUF6250 domain-containing protein [Chitinophagaceae bacterium]
MKTDKVNYTIAITGIFFIVLFSMCSVVNPVVKKQINIDGKSHFEVKLIYSDNFDNDLAGWIAEQGKGSKVSIVNGAMDVEGTAGSTVWFDKSINAPMMIEYDATIIDSGGVNDRIADLNCFWLATDPANRDSFFANSKNRNGVFGIYDSLQLYYVGLGGHNNTTTRFRKYEGDGNKPVLPENDLSASEFLITPNQINHVKIVVYNQVIQYYRNDQLIYNIVDKTPYRSGYFGIRGTRNHTKVDNFKVYEQIR